MADPAVTEKWIRSYEEKGYLTLAVNSKKEE